NAHSRKNALREHSAYIRAVHRFNGRVARCVKSRAENAACVLLHNGFLSARGGCCTGSGYTKRPCGARRLYAVRAVFQRPARGVSGEAGVMERTSERVFFVARVVFAKHQRAVMVVTPRRV